MEMISAYSADAVRYWAASTGPGKDSTISEDKIQAGARLVTKLWNVARFSERFLEGYEPPAEIPTLSPADHWILARAQSLIRRATELFQAYDYAAAKSEVESFFWQELADNYIEMAKLRLYDEEHAGRAGARFALDHVLRTVVKLLAPILPYVTEEVYQGLWPQPGLCSLHCSSWPHPDERLRSEPALAVGEMLVAIATTVRRYKSEQNRPLGSPVARLHLACTEPAMAEALRKAAADLISITRAQEVVVADQLNPDQVPLAVLGPVTVALEA
jgi:valyl-tRNA synthetase